MSKITEYVLEREAAGLLYFDEKEDRYVKPIEHQNQPVPGIEKGVPAPMRYLPPFPLADMLPGDSFVVTLRKKSDRAAARQRLRRFEDENPGTAFVIESIDKPQPGRVRIFRTE